MSDRRDHYARAFKIFAHAVEIPDESERGAYLNDVCRDDDALRAEVESLLLRIHDGSRPAMLDDADIDRRRAAAEQQLSTFSKSVALPDTIGRYRIARRIASGGMGTVFEAEQDSPKRRVALKMVHAQRSTPALVERLQREGEILGRLQHPGIAQIYDAGMIDLGDGAQPYFAMEYVDGVTLTKYADAHDLDDRQRLELLALICDAMQYAHDKGVIHRDLKPDNILVDADGRPKILDFGVARITSDSTFDVSTMTRDGQILGTLSYMAPEQMDHGPDGVTHRADIYALGVLGFELLAGRLPHDVAGMSIAAALRELMDSDAPRMQTIEPRFKGDVQTIIGTALDRDPERRYVTAAALAADIRRYLAHEPIHARPPTAIYKTRKFIRRNRALVGGTLATLMVFLAGIVVATALSNLERDQRQRADEQQRQAQAGMESAAVQLGSVFNLFVADDVFSAAEQFALIDDRADSFGRNLLGQALPRRYEIGWSPYSDDCNHWFLPDNQIACSIEGKFVALLDPEIGQRRPIFAGASFTKSSHLTPTASTPLALAWTEKECVIVDVLSETVIRRWPRDVDAETGEPIPITRLAHISEDGGVVVLDQIETASVLVEGQPPWRIEKAKKTYPFLSLDGGTLALNHQDGRIEYLDVATRESLRKFELPSEGGNAVMLPVRDGFLFQTALRSNGGDTWRFDRINDMIVERETNLSPDGYKLVSATPEGEYVVLTHWHNFRDSVLWIRDSATEQAVRSYRIRDTNGAFATISAGADYLSVRPASDQLWVLPICLDYEGARLTPCIGDAGAPVTTLHVSKDGSLVTTRSSGESFERIWDARTLELLATPNRLSQAGDVEWIGATPSESGPRAMRPGGASRAISVEPGTICIQETAYETDQMTFRACGPGDRITALHWLPDGMRLVSASTDGTVRVWDARPRAEQATTRREWVALREAMSTRDDLEEALPLLHGDERAAAIAELVRRAISVVNVNEQPAAE